MQSWWTQYRRLLPVSTSNHPIHIRELTVDEATKHLNDKQIHKGDMVSCAICFDEVKSGDSTWSLPCKHKYHQGCLKDWLAQDKADLTCPLCRQSNQLVDNE
jgi:hypothetical protein